MLVTSQLPASSAEVLTEERSQIEELHSVGEGGGGLNMTLHFFQIRFKENNADLVCGENLVHHCHGEGLMRATVGPGMEMLVWRERS